jgi:hypothetical protein
VALAAGARRAFLLVVCLLSLTSYVTLVFTLFRASAGCIKGPKGLMEIDVIPTARYFKGERGCGPATNPIRPSRTMCHSLGAHVRRKTLQSALQVHCCVIDGRCRARRSLLLGKFLCLLDY